MRSNTVNLFGDRESHGDRTNAKVLGVSKSVNGVPVGLAVHAPHTLQALRLVTLSLSECVSSLG
jgi:hypothetical protein